MAQIHAERIAQISEALYMTPTSLSLVEAAATHPARRWRSPLDVATYDRRATLSAQERRALALLDRHRYRWPAELAAALERLTRPIDDVLAFIAPQAVWWGRSPTRGALLVAMRDRQEAFWGWDREQWISLLRGTHSNFRQLVAAVAYLLCGQCDLHHEFRGFKTGLFARRVFGAEPVDASLARLQGYLDGLGHSTLLQRPNLQGALFDLMLIARTPLLDDLADCGELLAQTRSREQSNARRHGIEQFARTLVEMGVLEVLPFGATPTREEWLAHSRASEREVPPVWLEWAQRWFLTTTLSRNARQRGYYALIKAGRWLTAEHPDCADPGAWTRETAAAWIAAVDQMKVGDFTHAPNTASFRARRGGPLSPRTKAASISWLGAFFRDLQEWEWIERRFDPHRALAVPRSILALIGPDPRVIADDIWAKLLWAGLNLTERDLPAHGHATTGRPWYPLGLVRAAALLWLFGPAVVTEQERTLSLVTTSAARPLGLPGSWLVLDNSRHRDPLPALPGGSGSPPHGRAPLLLVVCHGGAPRSCGAAASASSRQRRRANFLRSRAHVVPMHRMQRLRPSGTSAGRPQRAFAARRRKRSHPRDCE